MTQTPRDLIKKNHFPSFLCIFYTFFDGSRSATITKKFEQATSFQEKSDKMVCHLSRDRKNNSNLV
jgi:hypothetical protein